ASWEYQTSSGLAATRAAARIAARRPDWRPLSSRAIPQATGTVAIPASAEGRRRATSPAPATRDQAQTPRYHSGGVFAGGTNERQVAPRRGCRTWTGVKASSYEKLWRSSVARRSAAASRVSAASGHQSGQRGGQVSWPPPVGARRPGRGEVAE